MNNKIVSFVSGFSALGMAALCITAPALAESRADVLERIRPIGKVNIVGQPAAAAPTPAPAAAPTPTPAPTPAPATEAAPAATPAPAAAPAAAASSGGAADGEAIYKSACFACHDGQLPVAPKIGDKEKWAPRIAKGMEALYKSAREGVAGTPMPPRGNCFTCSDEDLKAAVNYIVSKAK